jgi:glutathione S-transferase
VKGELTLYMPDVSTLRLLECSPEAWMVQLALEEKGLDYQVRCLLSGEHRSAEMLVRNPRGTLPVLTDGGVCVYETFAVLEYIEFAFPAPALLPESWQLRALALTRLHESSNLMAVGAALFHYLRTTRASALEHRAIDELAIALHDELFFWEHYYGMSSWAAGSSRGLADLSVFCYLAVAVHLGLVLDDLRYPHLRRYYERMRARASVEKTWPSAWVRGYTFLAEANA